MAENEITIGGWYAPVLDAETAKKIKDCSLDHVFFVGDAIGHNCKASQDIERSLGFCDEYGINAYVQKGNDVDIETAILFDKKYSNYKSYLSLLLYDEPSVDCFDTLFADLLKYAECSEKKEAFINLLPSYAKSESIKGNYKYYVSTFCEKFFAENHNLNCLSFDFYPLIYGENEDECLCERWLHDTYIVAKNAKKYGVKYNAFVQSMPFSKNAKKYGSRERIPSYEDLALQVYTYLAFGYTSIVYFCLGTPAENVEFSDVCYALLDRDKKETPTFDSAKKLNAEVKKLGELFCKYEWLDVKKLGKDELFDFAEDLQDFSCYEGLKLKTEGKLLVGEFTKDECEKAVLLVNFGETTATASTQQVLTFDKRTDVEVYQRGKTDVFATDKLSLRLNAGEGAFVMFKR